MWIFKRFRKNYWGEALCLERTQSFSQPTEFRGLLQKTFLTTLAISLFSRENWMLPKKAGKFPKTKPRANCNAGLVIADADEWAG